MTKPKKDVHRTGALASILASGEIKSINIDAINSKKKNTEKTPIHVSTSNEDVIHHISPNTIINWEHNDRPEFELGDIEGLAKEFISIGQQQPCIVRPSLSRSEFEYELIAGERRWRAAKIAKIDLKVIIKEVNDNEAALIQAAENDNRKDLSDYAKGMSFSRLIENKIIQQKDLIEQLGKSKQYVSALLSFSKIPEEVVNAIGDITNFKASAAERVKQLAFKSDEHKNALIRIGEKFDGKTPGAKSIDNEVKNVITSKEAENKSEKLFTEDGRHIATWRKNSNGLPSINFPKSVATLIEQKKLNYDELKVDIIRLLENKLNKLRKPT